MFEISVGVKKMINTIKIYFCVFMCSTKIYIMKTKIFCFIWLLHALITDRLLDTSLVILFGETGGGFSQIISVMVKL